MYDPSQKRGYPGPGSPPGYNNNTGANNGNSAYASQPTQGGGGVRAPYQQGGYNSGPAGTGHGTTNSITYPQIGSVSAPRQAGGFLQQPSAFQSGGIGGSAFNQQAYSQPYQQPQPAVQQQNQWAQPLGGGGLDQRSGGGPMSPSSQQQQQSPNWNQWAPPGVNEQMLNMGGNMAKSFISTNMARYQPGVDSFWAVLKVYFAVDNAYVLRKLKTLILPFLNKDWTRIPIDGMSYGDPRTASGQKDSKYARPSADANAPDLYLPLMAFITYALITGFVKGRASNFTPDVLVEVTSSAVATTLLEVVIVRLGLYLLGSPAVLLDLVAYTGYKYVSLCVNMSVGVLFGRTAYYCSLLWTGAMIAYFMLKTMANTVPLGASSRDVMLAVFAVIQALGTWWLGDSKDLQQ